MNIIYNMRVCDAVVVCMVMYKPKDELCSCVLNVSLSMMTCNKLPFLLRLPH